MEAPFRTVTYAVSKMVAGDTTYVRGGLYTTEGYINFRNSGTPTAPIRLLNYPGENPHIRWDGTFATTHRIELWTGYNKWVSDIVIEGLELSNAVAGISLQNGLRVMIRRNKIHDIKFNGIFGNGYKITADSNIVYKVGRFAECATTPAVCNQDHGFYITGKEWLITNNIIYDNLAYGLQLAGYPYDTAFHPVGDFSGFTGRDFSGFTGIVRNNTLAFQQNRSGIVIWQADAVNILIENNILFENSQRLPSGLTQGIDFYSCGKGHIVRNNLFYASGSGGAVAITDTAGGASYTASGNIMQADPLFKNATGYDFHLNLGSPAIDKGLAVTLVPTDFDGTARPQGAGYDIGAFEYISSTMTPIPPPPRVKPPKNVKIL